MQHNIIIYSGPQGTGKTEALKAHARVVKNYECLYISEAFAVVGPDMLKRILPQEIKLVLIDGVVNINPWLDTILNMEMPVTPNQKNPNQIEPNGITFILATQTPVELNQRVYTLLNLKRI